MSEEKREHWVLFKGGKPLNGRQANVMGFIFICGFFFTAIAVPTLSGLLFASFAAVMLVHTVRQLWRARESLKWPIVEAQILATRIDEHRGRHRSYIPVVRYRYVCVDTLSTKAIASFSPVNQFQQVSRRGHTVYGSVRGGHADPDPRLSDKPETERHRTGI